MPFLSERPALLRSLYALLAVFIVLLDQWTKLLVLDRIPLHDSVTVIPGFFNLTHVQNTGAAFGFFASISSPVKTFLLNVVALAIFAFVATFSLRTPATAWLLQSALALTLGGAAGNLIDRLRVGSVTDFLHFYIRDFHWWSFNIADSAITVGVCVLAWELWRTPEPTEAAGAEKEDDHVA
ncbi:MAG: signal peptidase II [Thermoanaerobaculia bacterium]|nr:signal peptidase II [Thermoanaerobaculia bacterium]